MVRKPSSSSPASSSPLETSGSPLGHQGGLREVQALGAGKVLQEAELVQRRRLETEGSQRGV